MMIDEKIKQLTPDRQKRIKDIEDKIRIGLRQAAEGKMSKKNWKGETQ